MLAMVGSGLLCVAATAAATPEFGLNAYDIAHADLNVVVEVAEGDMQALGSGGLSRADAIGIASDFAPIDPGAARTYRAIAAQYFDRNTQAVIVVITPGGTIPLDGPVDGPYAGKSIPARITGVILDAKTGAFLRGFMHNGTEP